MAVADSRESAPWLVVDAGRPGLDERNVDVFVYAASSYLLMLDRASKLEAAGHSVDCADFRGRVIFSTTYGWGSSNRFLVYTDRPGRWRYVAGADGDLTGDVRFLGAV